MPATRKRRTRTKSPTNAEIVAPGGGTQSDVNKLAKHLGLSGNAVSSILNCEGSGVASRISRSSTNNEEGAGNAGAGATSSAWADFMNEEGFGAGDAPTPSTTAPAATSTATSTSNNTTTDEKDSNKKLKTNENEQQPKATSTNTESKKSTSPPPSSKPTIKSSAVDEQRDYQLPITVPTPTPGILAQSGTLDSTTIGRTKRTLSETYDLQEPTILAYKSIFNQSKIAIIATSSTSAHSIAITTDGVAYAWGRNEMGQCGIGSGTSACVPLPTKIELEGKFVGAAVGKNHSVLVEEDGSVWAVGGNKYGQCGVNTKIEAILKWKKCVFDTDSSEEIEIVQASCGENFTVVLSSEGYMYSAGLSEFGQLGNGETGEYFISANKLAFANATKFERRSNFAYLPSDIEHSNNKMEESKKIIPLPKSSDIRIGSISCGKNHTVAIEAPIQHKSQPSRVFTWGCGGYGVLGHAVQADEYTPRLVGTMTGAMFQNNNPIRAEAGAHCSMILTENGHVYYCGKHRSVGEATMRPTLVDALANNMHVVKAVSGGNQSVFCATSNGVTVSWGMGLTGELGYGANNPKSSSKPKFVEKLDKCLVTDVACGYGHTLFLIRDEDEEDRAEYKKVKMIESSDLNDFVTKMTN